MNRVLHPRNGALTFTLLLLTISLVAFRAPAFVRASNSLPRYVDEYQIPTLNSAPLAITVDRNGMVWFTESNVTKIGQYNPLTSDFQEFHVPGVGDMWGIAIDQNGAVWFTQYSAKGSMNPGGMVMGGGHGRLVRFDPSNSSFSFVDIPTLGSFPLRLAIDAQDRIWFTELLGSKIGSYDQSTASLTEFSVPTKNSGPADLAFDGNGVLWFTETYSSKIASFNPKSGLFKEYPLDTQNSANVISSPMGIAVGADDRIWIADHGGNWIAQFQPQTNTTVKFPTHVPAAVTYSISMPNGLLLDKQGRVWFCEHEGNSVGFYDPDQRVMIEYRIPTGPISMALWIALAPDGSVWFTEWMTNQIGVIHARTPIPISLNASQTDIALEDSGSRLLTLTLTPTEPINGNGTVSYALSSYNQQEIVLHASPLYPQLNHQVQIQVQLRSSNQLKPGNYTLGLEIDLGSVIVSYMVNVAVNSQQNNQEQGIPIRAIFWAVAGIIAAVFVAVIVSRLYRKRY